MRKLRAFGRNYFLLCGVLVNLAIIGVGVYGLYRVSQLDLSIGELAVKAADRFQGKAPAVADTVRATFRSTMDYSGFDGKSLHDWRGKGASVHRNYAISDSAREISVSSTTELLSALKSVLPGHHITIEPGRYKIKRRNIPVKKGGLPNNPVILTARQLGTVTLELDTLEGFYVDAPDWIFQNLVIQGVCANDSRCEHAFHIVGNADSITLRNNIITDFNAAVKANGARRNGNFVYPDKGVIENNSFYNHRVRKTSKPTTVLDMVGVNDWVVRDSFIADFIKGKGNQISYAAFFKGNGAGNVFERNLVVCHYALHQKGGARVGLSFGGGGTGKTSCRNQNCPVEHKKGIIRHNIIAHCDDVGVYLNKSANTRIYNNTLINTLGIDVRFPASHAAIFNNILSGRIKVRDGGTMDQSNNLVMDLEDVDEIFEDGLALNFKPTRAGMIVDRGVDLERGEKDFCGKGRDSKAIDIGAIEYHEGKPTCNPRGLSD